MNSLYTITITRKLDMLWTTYNVELWVNGHFHCKLQNGETRHLQSSNNETKIQAKEIPHRGPAILTLSLPRKSNVIAVTANKAAMYNYEISRDTNNYNSIFIQEKSKNEK